MKMTIEEHHKLGTDLLAMGGEDVNGEHYGRSSAEVLALERMRNALLLVRSEMENRYRQESHGRVDVCRVYFGSEQSSAHFGAALR